ncbi:MAG: M20/M25/M40 family metallo-hydrolase [Acidobacteria bacterium]|nr:M20/M25/M40 family metallo-hydrolase [Acidobacteriota bacterium]
MRLIQLVILSLCIVLVGNLVTIQAQEKTLEKNLSKDYARVASQIMGAALVEGQAYEKLEHLSDNIGNRLSGSPQLNQAIEWAMETMKADGLENVHSEMAKVPHWVRGQESAEILTPAKHRLTILGLGGTIGTSPEGVTAEVVVVRNFDELDKLGEQVKGKIVLYNSPMRKDLPTGQAYGEAVRYRSIGAVRAAKYGAVAALVRSVTTVSLNTPHTGAMRYEDGVAKIPTAAVTIENAELMQRLFLKGQKITVNLKLGAKTLPDTESANVIGEIRGSEKPEEIILVSGHLDSWDVGTGSNDDGAGCVIAMEAVRTIAKLKLRPKRTIRVVLFTNEENGLYGAFAYRDAHKDKFDKHIVAIEADSGGTRPIGFSFKGSDIGFSLIQEISVLLRNLRSDNVERSQGSPGADISVLVEGGVSGLGLRNDSSHYFDIHHTDADTLDKLDRTDLALNVATMGIMVYVLADMPQSLPR